MATTAEMLTAARDAYHRLMLGEQRIELMFNGRRTIFAAPDADRLKRYIGELESTLAAEQGRRPAPRVRRVIFGGG